MSWPRSGRSSRAASHGAAKLFISRRAETELREIWRFIAADNPDAADRIPLRIDARIQILAAFPSAGAPRDDIRQGFRMLVEGNYLLLHQFDADRDEVELVAVVDGRRDLSGLL